MNKLISLKGINKEYIVGDNKIEAVKNINLDIKKGSSISIMGPSGCGKSTLLNIIGQITKPTNGNIIIQGKETSSYLKGDVAKLRNEFFGYIAQNYLLVDRYTVYENIEIPLVYSKDKIKSKERRLKVENILKRLGLEEKINEDVANLSGGQKQRVAIARALVNNPSLILADEPTGALDTDTGNEIMNLLLEFVKEGKTLIIVTHNEEISKRCDLELKMKDGVIL